MCSQHEIARNTTFHAEIAELLESGFFSVISVVDLHLRTIAAARTL